MATNVFMLMSVPGDKNVSDAKAACDAAFGKANSIASSFGSPCEKFEIPKLKVGTLDALMLLSDELDKFDKHADIALRRIVRAWGADLSEDSSEQLSADQLKVEMSGVGEVDPMSACQQFTWQEDRFPHKDALPELSTNIHSIICDLDDEVKDVLAKFAQIRNALNAMQRKSGGNLMVKDLNGIVKINHYPAHQDGTLSEKIVPVFVVISKSRLEEFTNGYETAFYDASAENSVKASKFTVPGSFKVITEDDSYVLARVLHLECPALQTYKNKLTELKFTVREFQFNAEAVDDARADREKLQQQLQQAQQQAKNTLQMAFGEVFLCHLHLKAIRLFVESVLWYGLPVNFQASVIKVNMRKEQGLKTALNEGFADAKPGAQSGGGQDEDGKGDHNFVSFEYDLDFITGDA